MGNKNQCIFDSTVADLRIECPVSEAVVKKSINALRAYYHITLAKKITWMTIRLQ